MPPGVGRQRVVGVGGRVGAHLGQPLPAPGGAVGRPIHPVALDGLPVVPGRGPGQRDLVVGERLGRQRGRERDAGHRLPHHRVRPGAEAAAVARRHPVVADRPRLQAPLREGLVGRAAGVAPAAVRTVGGPLHRVAGDGRAARVLGRVPGHGDGAVAVGLGAEVERGAGEPGLHGGGAAGPGAGHARRVHRPHAVVAPAAGRRIHVAVVGHARRQREPDAAAEPLDVVVHHRQAVQQLDGVPHHAGRARLRPRVGGQARPDAAPAPRRRDGGRVVGRWVVHRALEPAVAFLLRAVGYDIPVT